MIKSLLKKLCLSIIISTVLLTCIFATDLSGENHVFIDASVSDFPKVENMDETAFQLFSHGKIGALFVEGQWENESYAYPYANLKCYHL